MSNENKNRKDSILRASLIYLLLAGLVSAVGMLVGWLIRQAKGP